MRQRDKIRAQAPECARQGLGVAGGASPRSPARGPGRGRPVRNAGASCRDPGYHRGRAGVGRRPTSRPADRCTGGRYTTVSDPFAALRRGHVLVTPASALEHAFAGLRGLLGDLRPVRPYASSRCRRSATVPRSSVAQSPSTDACASGTQPANEQRLRFTSRASLDAGCARATPKYSAFPSGHPTRPFSVPLRHRKWRNRETTFSGSV